MIRIAIAMLVGDHVKYAGVLFGIAVTTFLTTLVGSMLAGMLSRTYALVTDIPAAEVWVMDPACETVTQTINIPETSIDRVRAVEGVAHASRLAVGAVPVRLPHGRFVTVDVIGVDDSTLMGLPADVAPELALGLRAPEAVLVDQGGIMGKLVVPVDDSDRWARGGPRLEVESRTVDRGDEVLVNNRSARVMGLVKGSPRFIPQPVLYATYSNIARMLPPQRHRLTFVLVTVAAGADPAEIARRIESTTGLRARTSAELRRETVVWFLVNSEVVAHVSVMVISAAAVGFAITGLMLYMFTKENAKFYAVLKALGTTNRRLLGMLLTQTAFSGVVGFGLGIGLCTLIGMALGTTGFPFRLMWFTPLFVGGLVVVVTLASAILSGRAVLRVEPAMVFKGG